MWYKVRELQSKGLNKTQIGKHLGVDRSTVRRYLQMSREDFVRRRNSHRKYTLKLAGYEEYVRGTLEEYPYISAARIHDWLKECYPDFPKVCDKTVFNFVEKVRCKYGIGKKSEARIRRDYEKLPDTPYGEYAQADFGEKWMSAGNGRSTKVYFFAIVLARSRYKFTFFARRPFDTELAIYAHECAFEYFGGKPEKILYDQDRVLISRENLGDLMLTRKFQTFVREQHFQPVFCHKADPESKGKVENVVKYVKENFLVARVFRDIDSLNREALEWLERTGNGKVHGTTRLVPREEFAVEKGFLMPYHGIIGIDRGIARITQQLIAVFIIIAIAHACNARTAEICAYILHFLRQTCSKGKAFFVVFIAGRRRVALKAIGTAAVACVAMDREH